MGVFQLILFDNFRISSVMLKVIVLHNNLGAGNSRHCVYLGPAYNRACCFPHSKPVPILHKVSLSQRR